MNGHSEIVMNSLDDYLAWKADKTKFDLIDYLMCVSTPDTLVATLDLMSPELIEVKGEYFIKHNYSDENFDAWMDKLKDMRDVQMVINHFHISSFMQGQPVANEVAVHVARKIASIWSHQFKSLGLVAESYGDDFETAQVSLMRK